MNACYLFDDLPNFLRQRTRVLKDCSPHKGQFVLYWMATAVRSTENPALDLSRILASNLKCPLLVYQGLSSRYPYASDRHHRFILEGARDVEPSLADMGISYLFHLEKTDHAPRLIELAREASAVVTEDFPTPPLRKWRGRVLGHSSGPVFAVDTACLVPPGCSSERFTRAFEFKNALHKEREAALEAGYPDFAHATPMAVQSMPFAGMNLASSSLSNLISSCPVDHTVPPVRDSCGGSKAARNRWRAFLDGGIGSYHRHRNNAALSGVSRMSPYLHYGHISSFRMATDAKRIGGKGPDKYLDELLIWRELAYHWCDKTHHPGAWEALPSWARESLEAERHTPRPHLYSWEELARGRTNDELWNLAQQSLLHHGELHNNVRMTWGKMLHSWTRSPRQTLRWLIDLNHRYALDGRDPSSYGGLLWCLGLFDRPFKPDQPVYGSVRKRTTEVHSTRLDLTGYAKRIARESPQRTIAVVGAGLGGLHCGRVLHDHRFGVTVFDKGRRPGGRANTRNSITDRNWVFDHGAPYFSANDRRVKMLLLAWEDAGVLLRWRPQTAPKSNAQAEHEPIFFVGKQGNVDIGTHLAQDLQLKSSARVTAVERGPKGWLVRTEEQALGPYDSVIFNLPANQIIPLWPAGVPMPSLPEYRPIYACMVRFKQKVDVDWDLLRPHDGHLRLLVRENSKPNRPNQEQWILHATQAWSETQLATEKVSVGNLLVNEFREVTGTTAEVDEMQVHLWRYAQPRESFSEGSFWDETTGLGICGDAWGNGVEGALLSGGHLAGQIMGKPHEEE